MADVKIQDVNLIDTPTGSNKVPVSDGSGLAKTISVDQIIGVHEAKTHPHTQYVENSELGTAAYKDTTAFDPAGTASSLVSGLASVYEPKNTNIQEHISSTSDPHNTQFDQLGGTLTKLPLNTSLAAQTLTAGEIAWNPDERCFDMGVNGVTLQAGQEQIVNVRNSTASQITNGTVCMATGTIGASGRITIAPMDGTNPANAMYLLGIATEDIAAGADGFVTVFGKVRHVNTAAYEDGDVLYTSTTTPGALTKIAPTSGLKQPIAFVVNAASNGVIFVRIETLNHLAFQANGIIVTNGDGNSYLANDGTYKAVSSGITDHGALSGLGDDDHIQYLNETRHDLLDHTGLTGIPSITGLLDETAHDLLDHTGLTGIPAPYALPTASTTVLGGVKVDGTSITIIDGVISAADTWTGDVVGPASATDNNIAVFDGITGKLIKDSGVSPSSFEAAGAVSGHTSTFDHTKLHDAVTVADSTSIDLTLTGQQISAAAIFGTTSGTVCQGNDSRLSDARTPTSHNNSAHSETYITSTALTGLLDETAHDLLDHTGLTGIPAAYNLPTASTTVLGGVKIDGTSITITEGVISSTATGGVTDHGNLSGLLDDDHTQYLNETRHDVLDHTGLTGIPTQYTDEMAQDAIGTLITNGTQSGITVSYDDVNNKLDFTVTASSVVTYENLNANGDVGTGSDQVAAGNHTHVGVYEPADATILKDADIGVTVQAYDANLTSWAAITPSAKQDTLISGTNIKTINSISILGEGNIVIEGGSGMTNPMTTAGDIIYGGASGTPTRLAKGTDGQVLTLASGLPAWAAASGWQSVTVEGTLALYVTQQTTLTITNYDSATSYSVNAVSGSASITGDTITYTAGNTAGTDTLTITAGSSSRDITITVNAAGIATPTNTTPTNGATDQSDTTLTLSASAFSWIGLEDTHASSDWELSTDSGFTTVVASSNADTINKTSWTTAVSASQTYYWRVKYRGASGRESAWSTATSFTTKSSVGGLIGTAGAQGFGVGVYNGTLPSGFSAMTGTTDPASDNYGNYQYSDGSVMCFVPRFYYRIGSASSPRYATYGANAVDIVGIETFADEASANAAGYAMHRAFIDGGSVKSGFFIDKYLCSPNGTTSGKSVKNGVPISLTANTSYTRSAAMTGCTGILADAVILSRARGAGFNTASIFMYSALALLSLAHGQAATAATYCAWYDAAGTKNFPKGCNNGALADHLDATVTFTTAGDSGSSAKPLTGSASNLAKTTHNGQNCGVADLNGAMYQVMLGLTNFGISATDATQHTNGNVYLLKTSVALSSLTAGWGGATDAWGDVTSLATKYDEVTGLLPWGATTGWKYMGNGTNRVFDPAISSIGYQRTSCGIPQDTGALSDVGTNLYGNDGQYQYNKTNLFPVASGDWSSPTLAGLFYRHWYYNRSYGNIYYGFRASCYGV